MLGTPINHVICASNKNNVLTDFFKTGEYNANRPFYVTNSPSMDILVSSNLERLLYLMTNDKNYVKELMQRLNQNGSYKVNKDLFSELQNIDATYVDEEETKKAIKELYYNKGILIDPHTSVAYTGYLKARPNGYTICVSTASPYKFPVTIASALGIKQVNEFTLIEEIKNLTGVLPDKRLIALKNIELNPLVCKKEEINYMVIRKVEGYAKN